MALTHQRQKDDLRKRYEEDGFFWVENLFTDGEVRRMRQRIEDIASGKLTHIPPDRFEIEPAANKRDAKVRSKVDTLRKINGMASYGDDVFFAAATKPQLLDIIEAVLGPNFKLFGDQLFVKPPEIGGEKPYHQDSAYFTIQPMAIITCWVALEDATLDNGCLHFVRGSHKLGLITDTEKWMVGDREDMRIPESAIDKSREVAVPLKAGSASFHHSLTLHKSGPNRTPNRRWGWAVHYVTSESYWTGPPAEKPNYKLLRGREFPGRV